MMSDSTPLYQKILDELWNVAIVDTHEHLPAESDRTKNKIDLFAEFFSHYASSDLISSGMSDKDLQYIRDKEVAIEKRWRVLRPYWEKIRNTSYARSLIISAKGLFDEDGITSSNYKRLAEKLTKANKKGWYRKVLKEKSNIDVSVLNFGTYKTDREFFVPVVSLGEYVFVRSREDIRKVEKMRSVSIHTLSGLETAMLGYLEECVRNGIVGIKIPFAYDRPINFDKTSHADAERAFSSIVPSGSRPYIDNSLSLREMKPLQDYLIHKSVQFAEENSLPIQIHTGLQEGNYNFIRNSDPTLLTNLFMEYPRVNFDIFHASFPFSRHLGCLAKNFRNVYIDMCWFHIITPAASRSMLHEWLDLVPANKIFGFGGDYCFVEGVYGHAVLARENIAHVLAERVEDGYCDEKEALRIGRMLLRDNAFEFFDIRRKRKIRPKKK
jgi:predicted TIM-barrel fold metal-dependent hydrolase